MKMKEVAEGQQDCGSIGGKLDKPVSSSLAGSDEFKRSHRLRRGQN